LGLVGGDGVSREELQAKLGKSGLRKKLSNFACMSIRCNLILLRSV